MRPSHFKSRLENSIPGISLLHFKQALALDCIFALMQTLQILPVSWCPSWCNEIPFPCNKHIEYQNRVFPYVFRSFSIDPSNVIAIMLKLYAEWMLFRQISSTKAGNKMPLRASWVGRARIYSFQTMRMPVVIHKCFNYWASCFSFDSIKLKIENLRPTFDEGARTLSLN